MYVQRNIWWGALVALALCLTTASLATAQQDVYLPYVYGTHMTSVPTMEASGTPLETATDVIGEEMPTHRDEVTAERVEIHMPWPHEDVPVPEATVHPDSRLQDTDGPYAMPPDVQAAAVTVFDDPDNFTVAGNLGVGTDAPAVKADIIHNTNGAARLRVQNTSAGNGAWADVAISTGVGKGYAIQKFGPNFSTFTWDGFSLADWARFRSDSGVAGLIFTTGGPGPLVFGTNDTERMRILPDGRVGIGTTSPSSQLTIRGGGSTAGVEIGNVQSGVYVATPGFYGVYVNTPGAYGVYVNTPGQSGLLVDLAGDDGVSVKDAGNDGVYVEAPVDDGLEVVNPGDAGVNILYTSYTGKDGVYVLFGDIVTDGGKFIDSGQELSVPDYVFEDDYPLMSLEELRTFIAANKHLPKVPNEADIRANGVDLSAFNMTLLEKVEEQTLYILQLERENDEQAALIATAARERRSLEQALTTLQQQMRNMQQQLYK